MAAHNVFNIGAFVVKFYFHITQVWEIC